MRLNRFATAVLATLLFTLAAFAAPRQEARAAGRVTYSFEFIDNRVVLVNGAPAQPGAQYEATDLVLITSANPAPGSVTITRREGRWQDSVTTGSLADPIPADLLYFQAIWVPND